MKLTTKYIKIGREEKNKKNLTTLCWFFLVLFFGSLKYCYVLVFELVSMLFKYLTREYIYDLNFISLIYLKELVIGSGFIKNTKNTLCGQIVYTIY